jgi:hypothetical protein
MDQKRTERWAEFKYAFTPIAGECEEIERLLRLRPPREAPPYADLSDYNIILASKELIFDIEGDDAVFYALCFVLHARRVELQLGLNFKISAGGETEEESNQSIRSILAIAAGLSVPVYPNTEAIAPILAQHHRAMLIEGFTAPDGSGATRRLKLTRSPGARIDHANYIREVQPSEHYSPSDWHLIRASIIRELDRRQDATQVVDALKLAISSLRDVIRADQRNENALQSVLTANPILLGVSYSRIIPKHRLGKEFEMDYALMKFDGMIDLLEIESSNLPVFNKQGNPTKYLVHAEQQVFDWFEWIESHISYARSDLPGMASPQAYVVIGRRKSMSEEDVLRLRRRNIVFRGRLEILTYDDLIDRADCMLQHFLNITLGTSERHAIDANAQRGT